MSIHVFPAVRGWEARAEAIVAGNDASLGWVEGCKTSLQRCPPPLEALLIPVKTIIFRSRACPPARSVRMRVGHGGMVAYRRLEQETARLSGQGAAEG